MMPLPTITPFSQESVISTAAFGLNNFASGAYTAANLALYIPFRLQHPIVVTKLFSSNGATASGNIDVGIYSADFTRVVSSGSTAQSGTDLNQLFDIADTLLGVGDFYLAVAMNNNTGTLYRTTSTFNILRVAGMLRQTSAFPLPAVATPVALTASYTPMFGLLWGRTTM